MKRFSLDLRRKNGRKRVIFKVDKFLAFFDHLPPCVDIFWVGWVGVVFKLLPNKNLGGVLQESGVPLSDILISLVVHIYFNTARD